MKQSRRMVLECIELVMYCIGDLEPLQHMKDVQIQNLCKHTSILHRNKVDIDQQDHRMALGELQIEMQATTVHQLTTGTINPWTM